jgi:hypothetical protein
MSRILLIYFLNNPTSSTQQSFLSGGCIQVTETFLVVTESRGAEIGTAIKTNGAIVNAMPIICSSSINQFEYVTYLKLMLLCDIIVSVTKFKVGPTSKKKLQLNNSDLFINNIFLVHSLFPHHLLLLFIL